MNEKNIKYNKKLVIVKPLPTEKQKKNPLKILLSFIIIISIIITIIYILEDKNIIDIWEMI